MSRRCELCGAKARSKDEACRECGSPLESIGSQSVAESASDITAVEAPAPRSEWTEPGSVPTSAETDPDLAFEDPPRRGRGPWIAFLGAAAAVGVGAIAITQLGESDAASPPGTEALPTELEPEPNAAAPGPAADTGCASLEALGGQWIFTTEVTGSRVVQSSGLNGFYTLDVHVQDCVASAVLTKTGYTARMYPEARLQRSSADLASGEGLRQGFASAAFNLESSVGPHGIMEFSFAAQGDVLSGVYRQRGARWRDAGLTGFLRGIREGENPRELSAADQPCPTRCHIACNTGARDSLATDALRTCVDSCTEDPERSAQCGDVAPLPEAYSLSLQGPAPLSKLCRGVGGCAKKIGRGHGQPPQLDGERLAEGWSEAVMVRAKKEGGVRLALHGAAGWWLSAPLFDAPRNSRLGTLRLYARQLAEGRDRRYVLGLARENTREDSPEVYLACRLSETPRCIRVPKARGELVNALPEGTLAVEVSADAPSGVFAW